MIGIKFNFLRENYLWEATDKCTIDGHLTTMLELLQNFNQKCLTSDSLCDNNKTRPTTIGVDNWCGD